MKPYKVFLFLIYVFVSLSALMLVFPQDGIRVINNVTLRLPTLKEIFFPEEIEYADITNIIDLNLKAIQEDTLKPTERDSVKANADELIKILQKFEYPDNNRTLLYPFFRILDQLKKTSELIRVLHYGDSQIEGDRITYFFRNKLQQKFGGTGVGLIPAYDFLKRFTIQHTFSDNWYRYTIFGKQDTAVKHKRYGVLASFSRFAPVNNDSIFKDNTIYEAWVRFEKTKAFKQCRLFCGYNKQNVTIELYDENGKLIKTDILFPNTELKVLKWIFQESPNTITIKFKGKDSPDIYTFAFDDTKGIAVDNISLRGSSGTEFTKINFSHLKQMYDVLNVKLVILQFGGNVIPYIKDENDCKNYGDWFCSQIYRIKKASPNVSIIVIGPSDMSKKEKGNYITYPLLTKVRDALKKATFKAGGVYWDMYEAMGGKNSMPSWVSADPPLAAGDFTHFSPQGAKIIANMFYNAFIHEYNQYAKTNPTKK